MLGRSKMFDMALLGAAQTLVPESLVLRGGVLEGTGGMKVDGKLTEATLISTDDSPIHITPTAVLDNCVIRGKNVFLEGKFTGKMYATVSTDPDHQPRFEFGSGCLAVGEFHKGRAEVAMHLLSDIDELRILRPASTGSKDSGGSPNLTVASSAQYPGKRVAVA